ETTAEVGVMLSVITRNRFWTHALSTLSLLQSLQYAKLHAQQAWFAWHILDDASEKSDARKKNDMITDLTQRGWVDNYTRLDRTYFDKLPSGTNKLLLNIAISDHDGYETLYFVRPDVIDAHLGSESLCQRSHLHDVGLTECLPGWMRGASSIKKVPEGVRQFLGDDMLRSVLAKVQVPCMTYETLVQFEKNMLSDWRTLDEQVIKLQDAGYRCRMTNVEVASCWREFAAENVHCERITVKMQQILSNVSDVKLEKQNLQEDCLPQAGMLRLPWMMRSSCALCIVLKLLQGTYIKSREQECCQGLSWIKFILMPQFDREWTRAGRLRGFSLAFTYACGVR
ncbi:Hypothetical protein SCF082_LOCUS42651, partial [Durusdinium trenchii]